MIKLSILLYFTFAGYHVFSQVDNNGTMLFNRISSFALVDTDTKDKSYISPKDKQLTLLVFLSPECPLCQNYTLTINQLRAKFSGQMNVYGIIPGNAYSIEDISNFEKKYHTTFKILIDSTISFTNYLKATVTPQAILVDSRSQVIYTGAIDDWVQALGKKKSKATKQYVADAVLQTLDKEPVKIKTTKAYGCKINDL
ncbi:hypothetical protein BH11BAC3_BH11BAC3_13010 [soil metagenome]